MYKKKLRELSKNRLNIGVWLMQRFFFFVDGFKWKRASVSKRAFLNLLQLVVDEQQFFFISIRVVLQRWFTIFCCCRSSPSNVQQQSHLLCHSLCLSVFPRSILLFTTFSNRTKKTNTHKHTHMHHWRENLLFFRLLSIYLHGRISWWDRRPILMFYWWYMVGNLIHFN